MSADIRQWQEAEGRSDEEMAELLSSRLGRTISAQGYRIGKSKKSPPAEWLHVLNIAPQEPAGFSPPGDDKPPADEAEPDRKTVVPLPFDPAPVHMQITIAYTMAGKGASLALRSPPVAEVWAQSAPAIASAYIDWAKEDANVARVLNALTLGGAKGLLVTLHAGLLVNTLIVSGRFNPERLVPPQMRTPQETDNLADDGSVVIDLDTEGGDNGNARENAVPPQGAPKRTRQRKAATA